MAKQITAEKQEIYLTDEQRKVVNAVSSGFHVVIAPAGCGKTAVLTKRVIDFLEQSKPKNKALCVTFTDNATQEMLSRIYPNEDNKKAARVEVSTLHALCLKNLNNASPEKHPYCVLSDREMMHIIAYSLYISLTQARNLFIAKNTFPFPDKRRLRPQRVDARKIYKFLVIQFQKGKLDELSGMVYGLVRNVKISLEDYDKHPLDRYCAKNYDKSKWLSAKAQNEKEAVRDLFYNAVNKLAHTIAQESMGMSKDLLLYGDYNIYSIPDIPKPYWKHIIIAALLYNMIKMEKKLVDYDDMLCEGWKQLSSGETSINKYKYNWIQVDEAQDLTPLQIDVIKKLILNQDVANIVYFGDPNQSIFAFHGGNIQNFLDIAQFVKNQKGSIQFLETNFRSSERLIEFQRHFLRCFTQKKAVLDNYAVICGRNNNKENQTSDSRKSIRLKASGTIADVDIPIEKITARDTREETEIVIGKAREMLEFFIRNDEEGRSRHFVAVLFRTNEECQKFSQRLAECETGHVLFSNTPFLDYPELKECYNSLKGCQSADKICDFINIEKINNESQDYFLRCLRLYARQVLFNHINDSDVMELEADVNKMKEYISKLDKKDELLEKIFRADTPELFARKLLGSTIIVSTVHKAKGLTFDGVVIPSVVDGNYPYRTNTNIAQMYEDLRVFYVAISRASQKLVLSVPNKFRYKEIRKQHKKKTCDKNKHNRAYLTVPEKLVKVPGRMPKVQESEFIKQLARFFSN